MSTAGPGLLGSWSDERGVQQLAADLRADPATRARAEDWLVQRDLLGAGFRLRQGLVPCHEPGHRELRRRRITIALRRLASWEALDVLAASVGDPDEAVRIGLAWDLAEFGEGIALDLLPRLARGAQPDTVTTAALRAVRGHLGRLPVGRVSALLLAVDGAARCEVPGVWVELARMHPDATDAARAACEALADDAEPQPVRDAALDALGVLDDLTMAPGSPTPGLWDFLTRWLSRS